MALFDNNPISALTNPVTSGIGGLFEGMTPFGSTIPSGILTEDQEAKLRNQALVQGLLGTAATYLATPKNLNAGSPLPYIGKAVLGGMGASQDVIDRAIRARLLAGKDDNIRTYEKDRQKITEQYNPMTKKWEVLGTSALDAPKEAKIEPAYTGDFANVASNLYPNIDPLTLNDQQRKNVFDAVERLKKAGVEARLAAEMPLRTQEAEYNIGKPKQSIPVTVGGKTYYFKDQNSANAFRQKAGIK